MTNLTALPPRSGVSTPRPDRRRRRIALVTALAVVFAGFSTWLVAYSSVLGVGSVDVHGTHVLSADEVRTTADVAENTPLVRVDTAAITRRVEQLPVVASARVSTSFPSTVEITVTERQPVAYLRTGDGDELDALLDRTGFPFRTVHARPALLPMIELAEDGAGGRGTPATRAGVAEVAAALPASLRARVRSIQALDPKAITLVLRHGKIVLWGTATRNADKARVVEFLLHRKNAQIDVTDPDQPVTR